MFDKSRGYVPAQKLSAFYGEKPRGQGLPKIDEKGIDCCLHCKKPPSKCEWCGEYRKHRKEKSCLE